MKTISRLLILFTILTGCAEHRYLLTDKGKEKRFLIHSIKEASKKGQLTTKPIVVVDGTPYRYHKELKNNRLPLSKDDIAQLDIVKKEVGVGIYGEEAKSGIMLVTTKKGASEKTHAKDDSKVFVLLGERQISLEEMKEINPTDVESIDVIKNKEAIKQYTSGDYDGVVIIHLKKTE